MIMTRPSFIYLLPIYILFWILRFLFNKEEKKQIITGLISCVICGIILLGYCSVMKTQHGEFSITSVSYINNVVTAIKSNAYKNATNQEMIKIVDEIKGGEEKEEHYWNALKVLQKEYSVAQLKEFASSSIKNNPKYYLKYLIFKTVELGFVNIGTASYVAPIAGYEEINYTYLGNLTLPINFSFVYIVLIICIIYLIWNLIKNKKIDWVVSFLTILILANLFTLIVGAPSEPQRLFIPSIVSFLILLGKLLTINGKEIKLLSQGGENKKVKSNKSSNLLYKLFIEKTDDVKIQFFRYLFVGGFAAVVNIGSLYILKEFINFNYIIANIIGFTIGLIVNYILSRLLVFAKEETMNKTFEFIVYTIIGVVGLGLDTLFIWLFTEKLAVYYMLSKVISTGLVFIWNFSARKVMYIIANKLRKDQ